MNEHLHKDWFKLPLKLRQRYWKETDYGRLKPLENLEKEIKLILSCNDVKVD